MKTVNGEHALTAREREVVALVAQGLANKEVARILECSDGTVKAHLHTIYRKLAITNRTVLATLVANGVSHE